MFNNLADFPNIKASRLRLSKNYRDLVCENKISLNDLICPVFIKEGI